MKKYFIAVLIMALLSVVYADDWQNQKPTGDIPSARYGHSIVEINGELYLFGGADNTSRALLNNMYKFIPNQNQWTKLEPSGDIPPAREGHSAVELDGKMYVLCGKGDTGELNDIWKYDPATNKWTQVTAGGDLAPRTDQGATAFLGKIYVFGGQKDNASTIYGDLWAYDVNSGTWSKDSNIPEKPRYGHSMIMSQNIFIYGGKSADGLCSDTWSYNVFLKAWNKIESSEVPPERYYAVSTTNGSYLWVCGGIGSSSELGDIWQYSMSNQTWSKKADGPVQSRSAGAKLDQQTREESEDINLFLFGGQKDGEPLADTWKYNSGDDPTPPQKDITAQIGALGKGRFVLYSLKYDVDQNVQLDLEWAEDKAKLRLFALNLPFFNRTKPFLHRKFKYIERFNMSDIKYFRQLKMEQKKARGRQTVTKTLKVKKGRLLILLWHWYFSKTAREIKVKFSKSETMPKNFSYIFPVGNPDKNGKSQLHFVTFPKQYTPVKWYSKYPRKTDGSENIISDADVIWQWRFVDKTNRLRLFPAYVKFYLP